MMLRSFASTVLVAAVLCSQESKTVVVVDAQQWAPLMLDNTAIRNDVPGRTDVNPWGWGDSYSVGNSCYCATTYDHDIDKIVVSTPLGNLNVRQICEKLGKGPGISGRPRYNDIQCGNGPANDAGDEDDCPGRIEYGANGCKYIGPKWNFTPFTGQTAPVPAPIKAPAPVPVPAPVPAPVPVFVPTPVVKQPVTTPTAPAPAPIFIDAKPTSGPSFTILGSSSYHLAPSGSVTVGTGGFDNLLFRPHRWSPANAFTYVISGLVPGASYTITMGFAETYEPNCGTGKRVFHVHANGVPIVQNLDVFSLVGCKKAYVNTQTATANSNGKLDLSFVKSKQNPFVSFINVVTK